MWAYYGRRGPDAPENGDTLAIRYFNGTTWNSTSSWSGNGSVDPDYQLYWGIIPDILAFHRYFQIELETKVHGATGKDQFEVDDFAFGCDDGQDEGDGVPTIVDCDPTDPNHWSDCFTCIDLDGDHYGPGCDLGPDCDDGDPAINPGAAELPGDGIDQDCDGTDMSSFFDDFESNSFDPAIWQSVTGDVVSSSSHHVSGSYAAQLGGGGGVMTTVPFDATYCTRFRITFWAKRGPETPDNGDNLVMEYRVGTGAWTNGQTILGTGVTESSSRSTPSLCR